MKYNKNLTVLVKGLAALLPHAETMASTRSYTRSGGFLDPSSLSDDISEDMEAY